MIGRGVSLGTILGMPIRLDYSWAIILALVTVGMAGHLSGLYPYLHFASLLLLGLSGAVLLFASVLAHELSHAVVALRHGVGIRSITLFVFGGAAEMVKEPSRADAELQIAVAGPAMSLVLGAFFGSLYWLGTGVVPPPINTLLMRLAVGNVVLVAFNVVPGFPLDGGRVLRAALWGIWGSLSAATRVAAGVGSFFGALVMFFGLVFLFFTDNLIGGLWFVLIGLFLRYAARASYQQMLVREALEGIQVKDLMTPAGDVPSVTPDRTLAAVVDEVMLPSGVTDVPVVEHGVFLGKLAALDLHGKPAETLGRLTVRDVMARDVPGESVPPEMPAVEVLSRLGDDEGWLPVLKDGVFVGVLRRDDALRRLKLLLELQEPRG